jgi:hypothetical protein
MHLPKRKPKPYVAERERLLEELKKLSPVTEEYQTVMHRLNELDKILNRTTELKKTVIPALGGISAVAGIYALQQFAGVLVPKALESIATRQEQKKHKESENF